ncbi:hypothetical protein DRP05_00700 [Archaeoglobales archaeon]|nr:MAG: hypothetical protein DRP05_00700 [Archaeoglobales archaeon]
MRKDRELLLKDVLYRMAYLWLVCDREERRIVKEEFNKFMDDIVNRNDDDDYDPLAEYDYSAVNFESG